MKTILVLGGTGMVGRAIQKQVHNSNEYNFVFLGREDANLLDQSEVLHLIKDFTPYGIINLAADCGGVFKNIGNSIGMFNNNYRINYNVLRVAALVGVKKVVSCLSVCVMPDISKNPWLSLPLSEKDLHSGEPHDSNIGYAYSKRMVDMLTKQYRKQGHDFVTVTPTNVFGPFDNFNKMTGHVIPCLIRLCDEAIKYNIPFEPRGSAGAMRQFIYSKDLAKLILNVFWDYSDDETIILSPDTDSEISIQHAAEVIADKMAYNGPLFFQSSDVSQEKRTVTNKKLRELYPDFTFTPFEKAIEETIQWLNSYGGPIRL